MYEALHDKVPGSIPARRLKFRIAKSILRPPASASLMRSQGRGRGRWGEWWGGGGRGKGLRLVQPAQLSVTRSRAQFPLGA